VAPAIGKPVRQRPPAQPKAADPSGIHLNQRDLFPNE
jgi:hypothetical protein